MLVETMLKDALSIIDATSYKSELQVAIDVQSIVNNRHFQDRFLSNFTITEVNRAVYSANKICNKLIIEFA